MIVYTTTVHEYINPVDADLKIVISAVGITFVVAVSLLFPVLLSKTSDVTVAVFTSDHHVAINVPVITIVPISPLLSISFVYIKLNQVIFHVEIVIPVNHVGSMSVTCIHDAAVGPLLVNTIVYTIVFPELAPVVFTVLMIDRSALVLPVMLTVSVLFPVVASLSPVIETVLLNPIHEEIKPFALPVITIVPVCHDHNKAPVNVRVFAPPLYVPVELLTNVICEGNVSCIVNDAALAGQLFAYVIVYTIMSPEYAFPVFATLLINKSVFTIT